MIFLTDTDDPLFTGTDKIVKILSLDMIFHESPPNADDPKNLYQITLRKIIEKHPCSRQTLIMPSLLMHIFQLQHFKWVTDSFGERRVLVRE